MLLLYFYKFITFMSNVNTIVGFLGILISITIAIIIFGGLVSMQKTFLDFKLTFSRFIIIY